MCKHRDELIQRLTDWGDSIKKIQRKRHEIQSLTEDIEDASLAAKGQNMDGMPHASRPGDTIGRTVAAREKILERIRTLETDIAELTASRIEMDSAIYSLPDNLERVILLRYQRGMTITGEIPQKIHVTERTARRWHEAALEALEKILF